MFLIEVPLPVLFFLHDFNLINVVFIALEKKKKKTQVATTKIKIRIIKISLLL